MGILHPALGEGTTNHEVLFLPAWWLLPWLMLMPSLRLMLIPTCSMAMVWAMAMALDTMDSAMAMDSMAMARGLLMLMPSLLLIPTTMVDSMDMVWATMVATVLDTMDWDMSMARGLLMLMPSLLLIPTMAMVLDMVDTMAMDMVWDTVDTTGDKSSHQQGYLDIHQDLSVNHQLLCQQKMDYFSLSFIPHQCCQFQCCQPSLTRNGKQEAIENQNVLIRQIKS